MSPCDVISLVFSKEEIFIQGFEDALSQRLLIHIYRVLRKLESLLNQAGQVSHAKVRVSITAQKALPLLLLQEILEVLTYLVEIQTY